MYYRDVLHHASPDQPMTETDMIVEPGDVVNMVCGGALMTVERARDGGLIDTVWFDNGILHRGTFPADVLRSWKPRADAADAA